MVARVTDLRPCTTALQPASVGATFGIMWVSKISELIGSSPQSFEAAAVAVVEHAHRTLRGVTGIRVLEKRVKVEADRVVEYRVRVRLEFDLAPRAELHW
jgi:flavin-binding protein dodecin